MLSFKVKEILILIHIITRQRVRKRSVKTSFVSAMHFFNCRGILNQQQFVRLLREYLNYNPYSYNRVYFYHFLLWSPKVSPIYQPLHSQNHLLYEPVHLCTCQCLRGFFFCNCFARKYCNFSFLETNVSGCSFT